MSASFKIPYSISDIPGELERRVFIGGDYDNIAVLRKISNMVIEFGYQPILAYEFDTPHNKIREYALRLVSNCGYAIFEGTYGSGHLIEIERTPEYVNTLLVYQLRDEKSSPPKGVTSMLSSASQRYGYTTFGKLREYLKKNFLPYDDPIDRL